MGQWGYMFRISKLADYAVVVLAEMAGRAEALMSAAVIAERTGVSEPTVAKVLKLLSREGVVQSVRGAGGGYRLSCPADEIAVVDIIEAIEGPIALTACVDGAEPDCALGGCCGVRGRWDTVNAALRSALGGIMLADIMRPAVKGCGSAALTFETEGKGAGYGRN